MSQAVADSNIALDRAVVLRPVRRYLLTTIQVDGVIRYRMPILREMQRRGWEVHVAAPNSDTLRALSQNGIHTHQLHLDRSSTNPFQELKTLRNFKAIADLVRPHLSHHFSTKAVIYGCLSGKGLNVATITGLGYSLSGAAGTAKHIPVRIIGKTLYKRAMQKCHHVIFQNDHDCSFFLNKKIAKDHQVSIIQGSGIDMSYFHPDKLSKKDKPIKFVVLSRMLISKGIEDFVAASRIVRERTNEKCEFILAGPLDVDNPSCIKESIFNGWLTEGSVKWIGQVPDALEAYSDADVAVLPSFYKEGLSRSLIEGAAMGLPLITTDNPGCRDAVIHNETGLIVPLRDPHALAEAMLTLISNASMRRQMGKAGRKFVEQHFSQDQVLSKTLETYDAVLTRNGGVGLD